MSLDDNLPTLSSSRQQIRQMQDINLLSYDQIEALKIIYPGMKDIKTLNTFRDLRTKLLQSSGKNNFSIMVTGLSSEAGTTYVSRNLAAAIALDFEKTSLLVDCNILNPSGDDLLSGTSDLGLTDYLEDQTITCSDIIYSTGIPRLRMTPIGSRQHQSSEYFTSDRMEEYLDEVKSRYPERFIILDTPPINQSPDARVLADLCDLAIIVVPYGRVSKMQITAGINSVPQEKFAGLVFNN